MHKPGLRVGEPFSIELIELLRPLERTRPGAVESCVEAGHRDVRVRSAADSTTSLRRIASYNSEGCVPFRIITKDASLKLARVV